jgi:predicted metalloprotease with PDZ domain
MQVPQRIAIPVLLFALLAAVSLVWGARSAALVQDAAVAVPIRPATRRTPPPRLDLAVDATDLARCRLRATVTIPAAPGRLWLLFPRWIPGTHAPSGLVENLAGLTVRAADGTPLPWRRDPLQPHRFAVNVPASGGPVAVDLVYLANQPTINSTPIDTVQVGALAYLNWNTALLYPEGWSDDAIRIAARLRLPDGWRQASALESAVTADGGIAFAEVSLRELVDAPVLCGRELAIADLVVDRFAPHRLALATANGTAPAIPPAAGDQLRALAAEARELFGAAPFPRYTWLLAAGRPVPRLGLEHLMCSLNGVSREDILVDERLEPSTAFLLAHEYGHAWCGKHRIPAGMLTGDLNTAMDTRLLWIYEGVDQYLGMILAARSGAVGRDDWEERLAEQIERVLLDRSRTWRTLEDTAASGFLLRGPSRAWDDQRGGQDYYLEGMLFCLEADGLIRRASGGQRSLDDVLRRFLAPRPGAARVPFTEAELVADLRAVEPSIDWPALIARRIRSTAAERDLSGLAAWGYAATWSDQRPDGLPSDDGAWDERWWLGFRLWRGQVFDVVPGSPADLAGLARGDRLTPRLTAQALDELLRQGLSTGGFDLRLTAPDGSVRTRRIACPRAARYLALAPAGPGPDHAIYEAILAPRSPEGRAGRDAGGW